MIDVQTECSAKKSRRICFALLRCSLSYPEIVQGERQAKEKPKDCLDITTFSIDSRALYTYFQPRINGSYGYIIYGRVANPL